MLLIHPSVYPIVEMSCVFCLQKLRDECITMHTEDHPYCKALIEAHLACLRLEGFNVSWGNVRRGHAVLQWSAFAATMGRLECSCLVHRVR